MRKSLRILVTVLIAVALLCLIGVWLGFWIGGTSNPRLSLTLIQTTDNHGSWKLQFGVTNAGTRRVITSQVGHLEVFQRTNSLTVSATSPVSHLDPGEGQVIDVVLSESEMDWIDGKWRFICLYAPDSLRSRIYQWQWGPKGPGTRANWLIPQLLKGMPLTAKGTNDWIEPIRR